MKGPAKVKFGLAALAVLIGLGGTGSEAHAADIPPGQKAQPRYKLTAGMGYTVCERYVRLLNALPADESPVCEQKLHPDFPDFAFPQWEVLDPLAHLDLILQIERWLYGRNNFLWEGGRRNWPTEEEYLRVVEHRIRSGEATPLLRRARFALAGRIEEEVTAYRRDVKQCPRDMSERSYSYMSRDYIFLRDEQGRPDRRLDVLQQHGDAQLLLRNGVPYWIHTFTDAPSIINFHVYAIRLTPGDELPYRSRPYWLPERCIVKFQTKAK